MRRLKAWCNFDNVPHTIHDAGTLLDRLRKDYYGKRQLLVQWLVIKCRATVEITHNARV